MTVDGVPLIDARGIGIGFPGVRAVSCVDFDVRPGEIHALVGENGAGKSTLGRLLCGELQGDEGELRIAGVSRRLGSPRDGIAAGVAMIPQELQLVTSLTVGENILLGHEPRTALGTIDRSAMATTARTHLDAVGGTHISPAVLLGSLSPGDRQLVAIARALSLNARCLIMDEPTAALGADEEARLERLIRTLAASGTSIVYVSHKLEHVLSLADRITVLRDGQRIATQPAADLSPDSLIRLMVGRDVPPSELAPVPDGAREVLTIERLSVTDPERPGSDRLREISLTVRAGEIVGLAGLVGAGRSDLLLSLVGAHPGRVSGTIAIDGTRYSPQTPAQARDAGLVMLPEERKADAIFPQLGVDRNITISALDRLSRFGVLSGEGERQAAAGLIAQTGVRAAHPEVPIGTLSGGNQQKALLARCLFASPTVLLLDEPTRGVDLAARADIYQELHRLAAGGFGVLLVSSDLAEILSQCHRILVIRNGRITAEFDRSNATEEGILAAAAGTTDPATSDTRGVAMPDPRSDGPLPPPDPPSSVRRAASWLARYRSALGLVAVLILAIIFSPVRGGRLIFLDIGNLTDILRQVSEKGILAVGMTAVVITRGIDLSVGSVLAFGATLSAMLLMNGYSLGTTTVLVLGAGALWGLLNGIVVARWRLPAFIATLATMSAARGAARWLSGGTAIPLGFGEGRAPESVRALAAPIIPYVPAPAVLFVATVLAVGFFLARTRAGRYVYAIGDNESAARLSGVRVGFHTAWVYVLSGTLAALAGLIHAAQLEQGNPNDGVAYELDAIAAVVIGGTSLSGGVGTVGGTLVGILIIGIINNIMGLNNVDANLQLILKGAIILLAVWLQRRRA
ncbi:MAG: ATP-binding cassette domain-containing protein [Gemmatimonadales bacterium]|nr:ATP-binding cassette domain-containing protein [Gemmatimonadales bacterium]